MKYRIRTQAQKEHEIRVERATEAWRKKQDKIGFRQKKRGKQKPLKHERDQPLKRTGEILKRFKEAGYIVLQDGRLEHRVICETHHGKIPSGWDVHHINAVPYDNRPENLIALPKFLHVQIHEEGNPTYYNRQYLLDRLKIHEHRYHLLNTRKKVLIEDIARLQKELEKIEYSLRN